MLKKLDLFEFFQRLMVALAQFAVFAAFLEALLCVGVMAPC